MSPLSSVATTHHHPRLWRDVCTCVRVRASYIPAIAVVVWHVPHGPPLFPLNPN